MHSKTIPTLFDAGNQSNDNRHSKIIPTFFEEAHNCLPLLLARTKRAYNINTESAPCLREVHPHINKNKNEYTNKYIYVQHCFSALAERLFSSDLGWLNRTTTRRDCYSNTMLEEIECEWQEQRIIQKRNEKHDNTLCSLCSSYVGSPVF